MKRTAVRRLTVLLLCAMASRVWADDREFTRAGMATADGFRLEEFLGRTWRNEIVRMPLDEASLNEARAGHALITADGTSVPYQMIADSASQDVKIAFAADLDPLQTQTFRFGSEPANTTTDLVIEQSDQWIRVSNRGIGISVRKTLRDGEGPVEAIRLGSGKWIGDSRLSGLGVPSEFHVEVIASGPVFAEISCRAKFGARSWQMRFSLQAADPVIVVDEDFSLGEATAMTINLAKNFLPDYVLYRHGKGAVGTLATWRIANDAEPVFVLEPWLRWWERLRQGVWFGLYRDDDPDLLAIGACQASVWVDPQDTRKRLSDRQILVTRDGHDVIMTLPLEEGRRRWLVGAMDRDASLEALHGDNLPGPSAAEAFHSTRRLSAGSGQRLHH
jgi:hypothetical protein